MNETNSIVSTVNKCRCACMEFLQEASCAQLILLAGFIIVTGTVKCQGFTLPWFQHLIYLKCVFFHFDSGSFSQIKIPGL